MEWGGKDLLVDTGGWLPNTGQATALDNKVSEQSEQAIEDADLVLFVVDVRVGIAAEDALIAEKLRSRKSPSFVVANKVDDPAHEASMWEFMSLGLGEPKPVSALHGRGTADLLDAVISNFSTIETPENTVDDVQESEENDDMVAVAIVGRPNVGKSTLFNKLIGSERAVVHDQAGTTRDAIDTVIDTDLGPIRFVDTAGMRRKARISEDTEYYSLIRALEAINKADIALLVIDATVGVTHQDQRLSERIDSAGCPIVVVLNKWELLDTDDRELLVDQVEIKLGFLANPPIMKISALSGKGVHRLFPILDETIHGYHRRSHADGVSQSAKYRLHQRQVEHVFFMHRSTDPPTFTFFVNKKLHRTYIRYLENQLRSQLDLGSTPIKIRVRNRNS